MGQGGPRCRPEDGVEGVHSKDRHREPVEPVMFACVKGDWGAAEEYGGSRKGRMGKKGKCSLVREHSGIAINGCVGARCHTVALIRPASPTAAHTVSPSTTEVSTA